MDLSNKIVSIDSMTVVGYPPESTVKVNISEEVIPGVFQQTGHYMLKFEAVFNGFDDPALLALINEKLLQLP